MLGIGFNQLHLRVFAAGEAQVAERVVVNPTQFRAVYEPMFRKPADDGSKISPLYNWREMSTYIRRPPYWEGALAGERSLKGMRPLALLPDNITTDHLSPSNAIMLDPAYIALKKDCLDLIRSEGRRAFDQSSAG